MPRLSVADCKALLSAIEGRSVQRSSALRAAARLRQRLEQAVQGEVSSDPSAIRSQPSQERGRMVRPCTLHVCTSCRKPGAPREPRESRPGFILYRRLRETFDATPLQHRVDVVPVECLSLCPRPCGISLSSPGAWTYLFGDQDPAGATDAIVDCVSLYAGTVDGFMPREERPNPLRASILGRVPPFQGVSIRGEPACI